MKLNTLIYINRMLAKREEKTLFAYRVATQKLNQRREELDLSDWNVDDANIKMFVSIQKTQKKALDEIREVRNDWNSKDWN